MQALDLTGTLKSEPVFLRGHCEEDMPHFNTSVICCLLKMATVNVAHEQKVNRELKFSQH
jgi:hypothetical protein